MKIAQEIRTGNVIMVGNNPMVVLKTEFNKSGRNAAVVKMKLKIMSMMRHVIKKLLYYRVILRKQMDTRMVMRVMRRLSV